MKTKFRSRLLLAACVAIVSAGWVNASPIEASTTVNKPTLLVAEEREAVVYFNIENKNVTDNARYIDVAVDDPVVAAHYQFTRTLPDKVVFVAGDTVTDIASATTGVLKRRSADKPEVGWRNLQYSF